MKPRQRSIQRNDADETLAQRQAMDAFCVAYCKGLAGFNVVDLLGTTHEHVAVMRVAPSVGEVNATAGGLKMTVTIRFDDELLSAERTAALARLQKAPAT